MAEKYLCTDTYRCNPTPNGRGGSIPGEFYFQFSYWLVNEKYIRCDIDRMPYNDNLKNREYHTLRSESSGTGMRLCLGNDMDANSLDRAKSFSESWAEEVSKMLRGHSTGF